MIHSGGPRRHRPFVAINCSGVPDSLLESELFGHLRGSFTGAIADKVGLIRQADGGTLFLDELGEMSLRMQAALLRFAEAGEMRPVGSDGRAIRADVRIIAATHRDLHQRMAEGSFREDLYYRLNVVPIHVPALRERREDIPDVLHDWLARAADTHGLPVPAIDPAAASVLHACRWPGNIRQLRNVAERIVLLAAGRPVTIGDLPAEVCEGSPVMDVPASPIDVVVTPHVVTPHVVTPHVVPSPDARESLPPSTTAARLWQRIADGEDFWTAVALPFKRHEVTRAELRILIDHGLQVTGGRYAALLHVFHLPDTDYKRFHAFLYQHQCNLPVREYRAAARNRMRRMQPVIAAVQAETYDDFVMKTA